MSEEIYNKLFEENTMLKSDNALLKNKIRTLDKKYLKVIAEKNRKIKEQEKIINELRGKQMNIFEEEK